MRGSAPVKWVTRENANVDRIACPWLIRRFIDPDAEFLFVPRDQVLETAEREGAHSYDAPGAQYTHREGKCSFDVLVEEYELGADPAPGAAGRGRARRRRLPGPGPLARGAGPICHRPRVRYRARHRCPRQDRARAPDVRRAVRVVPAGNLRRMTSRAQPRGRVDRAEAWITGLPVRRP